MRKVSQRIAAALLITAMMLGVLPGMPAEVGAAEAANIKAYSTAGESKASVQKIVGCSEEEWEVLYGTNLLRIANGKEPLSVNIDMQKAADIRKTELQTLQSHDRPNGQSCFTVLSELGIAHSTAGENIAAGYSTPANVLDAWWNSQGHRNNMLEASFTHLGSGYAYNASTKYQRHWVQFFTGNCSPSAISVVQDQGYTYELPADRSIDDLGLALEITCEHGVSYMPIVEGMCSGYDRTKLQQPQTVTVTYQGVTTTFAVMPSFRDVLYGDWYYDEVSYVNANALMTGLNETTFGPADTLSRAQFAVILHRMNGEPTVEYTARFPDVQQGLWYTSAILWTNDIQVVTGYSHNGLFGPADQITREQMAVMMYRYANYKQYDTGLKTDFSRFSDASYVSSFASEAMQWAVGTGIISGKDNGTKLDPQGSASRAECATIIMRFRQKYGV